MPAKGIVMDRNDLSEYLTILSAVGKATASIGLL